MTVPKYMVIQSQPNSTRISETSHSDAITFSVLFENFHIFEARLRLDLGFKASVSPSLS